MLKLMILRYDLINLLCWDIEIFIGFEPLGVFCKFHSTDKKKTNKQNNTIYIDLRIEHILIT